MAIYDLQALAERFSQSGGRRITITPETALVLTHALRLYADIIASPRDEGSFTIDVWSREGAIVEHMARASGVLVATAAFEQACLERRGYKVTLRQGVRIVKVRDADGGISR